MVYIWDTTPGTSFQKNIVVQKVLSAFLQNVISENASGYFARRIIRHIKMMNIILMIFIKFLTLTATAKRFCLLETLRQK